MHLKTGGKGAILTNEIRMIAQRQNKDFGTKWPVPKVDNPRICLLSWGISATQAQPPAKSHGENRLSSNNKK